LKDIVKKPKGYFKIEQFKNGELIDTFEDNNMIMIDSKGAMRDSIQGIQKGTVNGDINTNGPIFINTFILGTQGHEIGNILEPKSFTYNRNDLFSIENNGQVYPITFEPTILPSAPGDNITDEGYDPNLTGSRTENSNVTVTSSDELENKVITYIFEIPEGNANDGGSVIAYTEAALYTNILQDIPGLGSTPGSSLTVNDYGSIFAMRTFPAKIKDTNSSLKITWRIIF